LRFDEILFFALVKEDTFGITLILAIKSPSFTNSPASTYTSSITPEIDYN